MLDTLLEQARAAKQQRDEEEAARIAVSKTAHDAAISARLAVVESDLRMMLGSEIYDELGITCSTLSAPDAKTWVAEGVFTDADSNLRVVIKIEYNDVTNIRQSPSVTYRGYNGWRTVTSERLLPYLLELLVLWRDDAAKKRAQQALEQQQRDAEAEARRIAAEEAGRIDAEIREKIAALIAAGPTWYWKPGAVVILYVMTYVSGMVDDGDGGRYTDHEAVYTLTDALDERGYITTYDRNARSDIKLNMQAHLPVWERLTLRSVEDVPGLLLETDTIKLCGARVDQWFGSGSPKLYAYSDDPADYVPVNVGRVPVYWLREAVAGA